MAKLDRVLYNEAWDVAFPGCMLQALSSEVSDHCPMLLTCDASFKHCRRFRFENFWPRLEGFSETVTAAWQRTCSSSDPIARFMEKLRHTARDLRSWHAKFTNNLSLKAAITSEVIALLDKAMDIRPLSVEERVLRAELKLQRLGLAAMERSFWRQRSRVRGIKEDDASSRYFQAKASARRRKNFIHRLSLTKRASWKRWPRTLNPSWVPILPERAPWTLRCWASAGWICVN